MKVLITGGCGFIGSNLTIACSKLGWNVDVVDWDDSRLSEWVDKAERSHFIVSDYSHESVLDRVRKGTYEVIFHLAAIPRVSYSVENPSETTDENIGKMVHLLEAAAGNCRRFVFSSSSSVYGGAAHLPTPEVSPINPQSPYALQKSVGEQYLSLFNKLYDFDCVSLRYFNVFGPRQYADNAYASVISSWMQAMKENKPLRLDGTGEQSRDFCYVSNVVEANILAAVKNGSFNAQSYNIGCNDRISLNRILDTIKSLREVEVINSPQRAGDVDHSQADISKAREVLGYTASVGFEEGFKKTLEWWGL